MHTSTQVVCRSYEAVFSGGENAEPVFSLPACSHLSMASNALAVCGNCTPVVERDYESDEHESPAAAIISAVAEAEGVGSTDLPPLYYSIDPDAITTLLDRTEATETDVSLAFRYHGWDVLVQSDGSICICEGTTSVTSTARADTES